MRNETTDFVLNEDFKQLPVAGILSLLIGQCGIARQGLAFLPPAVEKEREAGVPQEQRHVGHRVPPLDGVPLYKDRQIRNSGMLMAFH